VLVTVAENVCVITGGAEVLVTVTGSGFSVMVVGLVIVLGLSAAGSIKVDCEVIVICSACTVKVEVSVPTEMMILFDARQDAASEGTSVEVLRDVGASKCNGLSPKSHD
jgi:hypothetical protein